MKLKVFLFAIFAFWVAFYYLGNHTRVQAFLLYHKGSYHSERAFPVPPERRLQAQQFERALGKLKAEFPELADPSPEPLLALANESLRDNDSRRSALLIEFLQSLALHQRYSQDLTVEKMEAIASLEQALDALTPDRGPLLGKDHFAGNLVLSHRFLIEERSRRWEVHEENSHHWLSRLFGGYFAWSKAIQELRQLDQWHRQINQGESVEPPEALDFREVHEALLKFSPMDR